MMMNMVFLNIWKNVFGPSLMQNEMNAQERRKIIDKVAAAVILQGWLDRRKQQLAQGQTQ